MDIEQSMDPELRVGFLHFPPISNDGNLVAAVQQYIDEHGQEVWQQHLPKIEHVYQQSGDTAYGLYSRNLFLPLEDELKQAALSCEPALPATFPSSREQWGPQ